MSQRKSLLGGEGAAPSPLRRSSRLSSSSPVPTSNPVAGVITRRRSSASDMASPTPAKVKAKRASLSQDIEEKVDTPKRNTRAGSASRSPENKTPARRGRRSSVSTILEEEAVPQKAASPSTRRRSVRGQSKSPTNENVELEKPRGRRASISEKVVPLEVISENEPKESKPRSRPKRTVAVELIEEETSAQLEPTKRRESMKAQKDDEKIEIPDSAKNQESKNKVEDEKMEIIEITNKAENETEQIIDIIDDEEAEPKKKLELKENKVDGVNESVVDVKEKAELKEKKISVGDEELIKSPIFSLHDVDCDEDDEEKGLKMDVSGKETNSEEESKVKGKTPKKISAVTEAKIEKENKIDSSINKTVLSPILGSDSVFGSAVRKSPRLSQKISPQSSPSTRKSPRLQKLSSEGKYDDESNNKQPEDEQEEDIITITVEDSNDSSKISVQEQKTSPVLEKDGTSKVDTPKQSKISILSLRKSPRLSSSPQVNGSADKSQEQDKEIENESSPMNKSEIIDDSQEEISFEEIVDKTVVSDSSLPLNTSNAPKDELINKIETNEDESKENLNGSNNSDKENLPNSPNVARRSSLKDESNLQDMKKISALGNIGNQSDVTVNVLNAQVFNDTKEAASKMNALETKKSSNEAIKASPLKTPNVAKTSNEAQEKLEKDVESKEKIKNLKEEPKKELRSKEQEEEVPKLKENSFKKSKKSPKKHEEPDQDMLDSFVDALNEDYVKSKASPEKSALKAKQEDSKDEESKAKQEDETKAEQDSEDESKAKPDSEDEESKAKQEDSELESSSISFDADKSLQIVADSKGSKRRRLEQAPGTVKIALNEVLEDFISKKLKEQEEREKEAEDDDEDESDDEDYYPKSSFLDDEASEGEEDTPSEGSNDIIDEGESLHSSESDDIESDEDYDEDDSFIADNESVELLSGNEFDLDMEEVKPKKGLKKRKSRIIKNTESEDEEEEEVLKKKEILKEKDVKTKKVKARKSVDVNPNEGRIKEDIPSAEMSKKISMDAKTEDKSNSEKEKVDSTESSSEDHSKGENAKEDNSDKDAAKNDDSEDIEIPKEKNSKDGPKLNTSKKLSKKDQNSQTSEKIVILQDILISPTPQNLIPVNPEDNLEIPKEISQQNLTSNADTPNNSLSESSFAKNRRNSGRKSSISIQEQLKIESIQEGIASINNKFNNAVDFFMSSIGNKSGNVQLNVSLDYAHTSSHSDEDSPGEKKNEVAEDAKTASASPKKPSSRSVSTEEDEDFKRLVSEIIDGPKSSSKKKSKRRSRCEEVQSRTTDHDASIQDGFIITTEESTLQNSAKSSAKKRTSLPTSPSPKKKAKKQDNQENVDEDNVAEESSKKKKQRLLSESKRSVVEELGSFLGPMLSKKFSAFNEAQEETSKKTKKSPKKRPVEIPIEEQPKKKKNKLASLKTAMATSSPLVSSSSSPIVTSKIQYFPSDMLVEVENSPHVSKSQAITKKKSKLRPTATCQSTVEWDITENRNIKPSKSMFSVSPPPVKAQLEKVRSKLLPNDFRNQMLYRPDIKRTDSKKIQKNKNKSKYFDA